MFIVVHVHGMVKWHTLQDRLDLKKVAEKAYSPTEKIMINQLWNYDDLHRREKDKYPPLLEVDMHMTDEQVKRYSVYGFYFDNTSPAIPDPWPKGVIRYRFSRSERVKDKTVFIQAMQSWKSVVKCIDFVEDKTSRDERVLHIVQRKLTFASVGFRPERKKHFLSVADVAQTKPVILHLLGHVLGLGHSHSRPDRDRFLIWMRENVELRDILYLNTKQDCPYDLSSVMHFDQYAFTMDRNEEMSFTVKEQTWSDDALVQKALAPKNWDTYALNHVVGKWETPSMTDKYRVEASYQTEAKCVPVDTDCLPLVFGYEEVKLLPAQFLVTPKKDFVNRILYDTENPEDSAFTINFDRLPTNGWSHDVITTGMPDKVSDEPCARTVWVIQPAQEPTLGQLGFFLLTGCSFIKFEFYDYLWDHHELFCAAQFARMYRKAVFTSSSTILHIRTHKIDRKEVNTLQNGVVKVHSFTDWICAGNAINEKCSGLPDPKLVAHFLP